MSQKLPSIIETMPSEVTEALTEAIIENPLLDITKWAEHNDLPVDPIMRLSRNPRFAMNVARACADQMARSALPKAVGVLNQALTDQSVPWPSRLDAARMVFTSAKPYVDGHLDRERAQDELENMSVAQLEALVRKMEDGMRDVTPQNDAPNDTSSTASDAMSVLNS